MVIHSQVRKLELLKKTQYKKGENPKKYSFPVLPGVFFSVYSKKLFANLRKPFLGGKPEGRGGGGHICLPLSFICYFSFVVGALLVQLLNRNIFVGG